ncbi:MAG: HAD-IA family hydrolase [Anaerolineae bacterium]|jgi:putative hydrolase of the HAD superfamily|nr:HAD-IA family hydrolase [Anaerolineae bacterium]MBT7074748.1 HAD-IA family hydrolase [Anaerolineae bacterium]MBT7782467.1 HAD-IA family hydrolase [Anaerolineae bacterium]
MLKALIFDFDGLILDTETPEFDILQEIYARYDTELSIKKWGQLVGGQDAVDFDPVADLEKLTDLNIPRESIMKEWRTKADALIASNSILLGVIDILDKAQKYGLGLAIASSSEHWWVDSHLKRLGIFDRFDHIICADDVVHTKPSPELFLLALKKLKVKSNEAVIFEDSPNGVKAANAAGVFVVSVPNPVTSQLIFPAKSLRLSSLEEFSLERLSTSFAK